MHNDSRIFDEKYNLKTNENSFRKISTDNVKTYEVQNLNVKKQSTSLKKIFTNPIAIVSIFIVLAILIYSYIGVLLSDFKPNEVITASQQNGIYSFFGVDVNGYDVFTRTMKATSRTFELAILTSLSSMIFGSLLGALAVVNTNNATNKVLSKIVDVYNLVPTIIWYAIFLLVMPKNYWSMFGVLALTSWQKFFTITRNQVHKNIIQNHNVASEMIGVKKTNIIFKHVLPNVYGHIIGQFFLTIANIIVAETSLNLMFPGLIKNGLTLGEVIVEASSSAGLAISNYVLLPTTIVLLVSISMYASSHVIVKAFELKNMKGVAHE